MSNFIIQHFFKYVEVTNVIIDLLFIKDISIINY